jgi:hypothetical protein
MSAIDRFSRNLSHVARKSDRTWTRRSILGRITTAVGGLSALATLGVRPPTASAHCALSHSGSPSGGSIYVRADSLNCRSGPHVGCFVNHVAYCGDELIRYEHTDNGDYHENCFGSGSTRWYKIHIPSDPFPMWVASKWTSTSGSNCCGVLFAPGEPVG